MVQFAGKGDDMTQCSSCGGDCRKSGCERKNVKKMTIDCGDFKYSIFEYGRNVSCLSDAECDKKYAEIVREIDEKLAEAYERGRREAMEWQPIETATMPMPAAYLVMNSKGQVAPLIDGVINNTIGTDWDWAYGESVTHFMPMPLPKEPTK